MKKSLLALSLLLVLALLFSCQGTDGGTLTDTAQPTQEQQPGDSGRPPTSEEATAEPYPEASDGVFLELSDDGTYTW